MGGPSVEVGATSGPGESPAGRGRAGRRVSVSHLDRDVGFSRGFPQVETRKLVELRRSFPQGLAGAVRGYTPGGRVRDAEGQDRAGGDAQGRRHHGRRRRGAGPDRRGRRCLRGDGARARARGHPQGWRRRAHERPGEDHGDPGSRPIPVMAKCRIGHFAEAQILEALEVDYIDESEVLTPADLRTTSTSGSSAVPFVCGATNSARRCGGSPRAPR